MQTTADKPSWDKAPEWANSLGICVIPNDESYGKWCWCSGTAPIGFDSQEQRPTK